MLEELQSAGVRAPIELVILRPEGSAAGNVLGWRSLCQARSHFFLRPESPSDVAALVRQLTGRGIGLVLGGGGARGFAHLGLMRALNELDIPVDVVGGTSMGAFFAGLVACGYSHHEMTHLARETFVRNNYLNDYLFPTVALIRGRKFVRRLHDIFGDRRIEELRTPFFCVSTNLTRGAPVIHDRGALHLWLATSMAVPGVAPPVAYRGDLLVDGAVVNSLPTDVMQALQRAGNRRPGPGRTVQVECPRQATRAAVDHLPYGDADQRKRSCAARSACGSVYPHAGRRHCAIRLEASGRGGRTRL
jgi:NTE family protein